MAKIKIKDLPKDQKISREEMKKTFGGIIIIYKPETILYGLGGDPHRLI